MKEYQLSKEFAENWCAELRNNKLKQGTGQFKYHSNLHNDFCYCANGVGYIANGYEILYGHRVEYHGLDCSIWNTFGRLPVNPFLINKIVYLNDDLKLTFPQISDWIEENVEFI